MSEARSAAAQAGVCDEQQLARDVLRELAGANSVTACVHVWTRYVEPVERSIDPETLAQLERAMRIRVTCLAPDPLG